MYIYIIYIYIYIYIYIFIYVYIYEYINTYTYIYIHRKAIDSWPTMELIVGRHCYRLARMCRMPEIAGLFPQRNH